MNRLLYVFTLVSILALVPFYGSAAPSCAQIFQDKGSAAPAYADTIASHLQTLKHNLNQLRKSLKDSKGEENRLEALSDLEMDPRESAYILQGAYRLLLAHPNARELFTQDEIQSLEKGLKAMKTLEKTLGGYQVQSDLYETAKKMKMPQAAIANLKKARNAASENVLEALRDGEYLDKKIPAITNHLERLANWQYGQGHDSRMLEASLQSEIDRIREKVEVEMKPLILARTYTHHELEYGAHAFRRSLRWLKVYILAYPEYFAARIQPAEFARLEKMIEDLRKIKKPGEMREKMTEQLSDMRNGKASSLVNSKMANKFEGIELRTQAILKDYEDHDGFTHLLRGAR